jgi:Ohr subfamily peroxiredoxin
MMRVQRGLDEDTRMDALYTATATARGGRNGEVKTDDGIVSFRTSVPKSMGGPGAAGATNPEQLFASGYSSCFGSAIEFVARQKKVPVKEVEVTARVSIGPKAGGGFLLATELDVRLPGIERATAEQLVNDAHQVCPYSNATRGNMDVRLRVLD